MKKHCLLSIFIILSLVIKAQNYNWANAIGSLGNDYAESITTDVSGNVYVTGSFIGTVDFDPSANTANLTSNGNDIFIAKYDNNGNYIWAKAMLSSGSYTNAIGRSIITDVNGNVYITGYFSGTTDFDPGTNTATLTPQSAGISTIYIAKYDANGNYIWVKAVNGSRGESKSITIDNNSNLYITGFFVGTGDFDPSTNVSNLTALSYNSAFVAKYDSNGNYLWVKGIGSTTSQYDGGMSVATDINNNVYVTGFFEGNAVDISTYSPILYTAGGTDIFIAKYDANGNNLWAKSIGSPQSYEYGVSLTTDVNSNVYVTGRFSGTADFDPSSNFANLSAGGGIYGGTDIFIAKYTTNGSYTWAHAFGVAGYNDSGVSVKTDNNGDNVYIMGYVAGTADFDPSSNTANLSSAGGNFLAKYNVNGNYVWAENIGNGITGDDANHLMTVDGLGNIYVTSYFQGTVDFDPSINTANLTSAGNNDIFIVKYSPCYTVNNPQQVCGNYSIGNSTYTATGTYTNILQSVLQCDSVVITQLTVNPLPTFTLSSSTGTITCQNPAVGCVITTTNNFAWSGPGVVSPSTASPSITINAPGIYTVALVNGLCQNSGNFTVTSNTSLPSFTMAYNTVSVCAGSSVSISANPTATNSVSYFWNNAASTQSIIVSPTVTTVYTVTVTDNINGCYASGSTTVDIYAQSTLTIAGNNSVCIGSSGTLTVTNGGIVYFLWSNGSTQPVTNVTPAVNSIYTVNTIDINGCGNSGTANVTVNPTPTISVNSGSICSGDTFIMIPSGANTYTYSAGSDVVNPITSTSYTIIGSDVNGCSDTVISSINVNPIPIIVVNSGAICSGQSFTIIPSGANTYTYSGGSDVVSPTADASYSISGTDANGCISVVDAVSNVTVNILPTINAVSSSSSVCLGTSVNLLASGATTYTWNTGATNANETVIPTLSLTYSVIGTDANNCSNTQVVSIIVDNTCADVWPGDANSDGLADNLDVLELGLHYAQTGAPRATASNTWQSYFSNNWTGTITNGKNLNHSDCNGDGTINDNDTLAIYNNYGLAHAFKTAQTNTVNPQLSIVPDQIAVAKGVWGTASVYLGDATNQINNINGIAFTVDFDNTLIQSNNIYIEYQPSFMNASQNLHFRKLYFANGKIFTATTHTINNNVSGFGKIATLHYQIKSNLTTDQVLNLGITQANQSDASGAIVPLTSGTGTLMAMGSSVGLLESLNFNLISISPNPTNGLLTINSKADFQKIEFVSITGQVLLSEIPTSINHTLHLENFANGIYFVNMHQNNRIIKREKVVLNK